MCKDERTYYSCGHEYLKTVKECGNPHCGLRDKFSHLNITKDCRCDPCLLAEEKLAHSLPSNLNIVNNKLDQLLQFYNQKSLVESQTLATTALNQNVAGGDVDEGQVCKQALSELGGRMRKFCQMVVTLGLMAPIRNGLEKLEKEFAAERESHKVWMESFLDKKQFSAGDIAEAKNLLVECYRGEEQFRSHRFQKAKEEIIGAFEKRILAWLVVGFGFYMGVYLLRGVCKIH